MAFFWASLVACAPGVPSPKALPAGVSFSGTWDTNWGQMKLEQQGKRVFGRYKGFRNGALSGEVDGNLLLFKWTQHENQQYGRGYLVITPDGSQMEGRWGYKKSRTEGGRWWANRAE